MQYLLFVWGCGAMFTMGWMLADRAQTGEGVDLLDVAIAAVMGVAFWPCVLGYDCRVTVSAFQRGQRKERADAPEDR